MIALLVLACGTHTPVDVQLDVQAAEPDEASIIKLCALDGPEVRTAARDGDYVIVGVPEGSTFTVDVLDETDEVLLRAGPLELDAPWMEVDPADCSGTDAEGQPRCARPCQGTGDPVDEPGQGLSVAVRYRDVIE